MAKKERFSLDEFDIGNDLNVPDFDFDLGPPKDDRKPSTKFVAGALSGAKSQALSAEAARRMIQKSLPKGYGSAIDLADQSIDTIKTLTSNTVKELRPMIGDLQRATQKILPAVEKTLPKSVSERVRKWSTTSEDKLRAQEATESARRDAEIAAEVAAVFADQSVQDRENRVQDKAEDKIRDGINQARHAEAMGAMGSQRMSGLRQVAFQEKIAAPYYRKSLEMQFRQYRLSIDAMAETKRMNAIVERNLADITKNTGLPDYVKLQNKEYLAQVMRNKFIDGVGNTLFSKRKEFVRGVGQKLISSVGEKVGRFASGVRQAASGAESLAELAQMQRELGGPGGIETAGSLMGGAGVDYLADRAGKRIRNTLTKNDNWARGGNKVQYMVENLPQVMGTWAQGYKGDDTPVVGGLIRFFKELVRSELQGPSQRLETDNLANLQAPAQFSRRSAKSLEEIIPGYLALLLREVTSLRTGAPAELVTYDFKANKFDGADAVKKRISSEFVSDRGKESINRDINQLLDQLDPDGTKLSPQQRRTLGRQLIKDNLSNTKEGDPDRYKDSGAFSRASSQDGEAFAQLFRTYFGDDKRGEKKLAFSREFNRLGESITDRRELAQQHVNAGNLQTLVELGVVNPETNSVDMEKLFDLYLPAEAGSSSSSSSARGPVRRVSRNRNGAALALPAPNNRRTFEGIAEGVPATGHAPAASAMSGPTIADSAEIVRAIGAASTKTDAEKTNEILLRIDKRLEDGITMWGQSGDQSGGNVPFTRRTLGDLGSSAVRGARRGINWVGQRARQAGGLAWGGLGTAKDWAKKAGSWTANKWSQVHDVYIQGELVPRLLKAKLEAGQYFDQITGDVIRTYKDIKGTVVDENGDIVIDASKGEIPKLILKAKNMKEKLLTTLGATWDTTKALAAFGTMKLGGIYGQALLLAKKGYDKLLNGPQDVYVVGKQDPVLLAVVMRAGGYASRTTSKPIRNPDDIDGPVYDQDGNIVLTNEDIGKGLVDKHGRPLKTGLLRALQMGKDVAMYGLNKVRQAGRWIGDKFNGIKDGLGNLGGFSFQMGRSARTSARLLLDIRDMLNDRLPGERTKFTALEDRDPELRGTLKQQLSRTKEKAKELRNKARDARDKVKNWFNPKKDQMAGLFERYFGKKRIAGDSDGDGERDGSASSQLKRMKQKALERAGAMKDGAVNAGRSGLGMLGGGAKSLWDMLTKRKKGGEEDDDGDTNVNVDLGGDGESSKRGGKKGKTPPPKGFWNKTKHYGKKAGKGAWNAAKFLGLGALGFLPTGMLGSALAGAGSLALSAGGALLAGLGSLAAGVLSVLSSPVVLGAAAIAAVGAGAYYGYKWLTKKSLDKYNTFRYAQYGFMPENTDQLNAVFGLEDLVAPGIIVDGGEAKLDTKKIDFDKAAESFGVDKKDQEQVRNWIVWFTSRFRPVFLSHWQAIKALGGNKTLNDVEKLKPEEMKKYLAAVRMPEGPYSQGTSPFPDLKSLKAGYAEVSAAFEVLKAETEKAGATTAAKAAGGAAAGLGAAAGMVGKAKPGSIDGATASGVLPEPEKIPGSVLNTLVGTASQVSAPAAAGMIQRSSEQMFADAFGGNRIDAMTAIRYKTYGMREMEADKVRAISLLETYVMKDLAFKGTRATWSGSVEQAVLANGANFGVEGAKNTNAYNWITWFNLRFLPVFLNYASAVATATGRKTVQDAANNLKPIQAVNVANVIYTTNSTYNSSSMSVWQIPTSPWPGFELNNDVKSTVGNADGLRERARQTVLEEDGKTGKIDGPTPYSTPEAKPTKPSGFWDKVTGSAPAKWVKNAWDGAKDVTGYSGREIDQPGKGTGGDINAIPKPQGNGSWGALKDTILAAAKMVGVDGQLMAAMAAIESSFNYTAKAAGSSATGLYQFISSTWRAMLKKHGPKYGIDPNTPPTDPRANALMGAEYIKENTDALSSLGRPLTDTDLYFAHFLGSGGAKKFLSADPSTLGASLMPNAAQSNPSIFYNGGTPRTVGEIQQLIANRVRNKASSFGGTEGVKAGTATSKPAEIGPAGKAVSDIAPKGQTAGEGYAGTTSTTKNPIGSFPIADQGAVPSSGEAPMQQVVITGKRPVKESEAAPNAVDPSLIGLSPRARNAIVQHEYQRDEVAKAIGDVATILSDSFEIHKLTLEEVRKMNTNLTGVMNNVLKEPVQPTTPAGGNAGAANNVRQLTPPSSKRTPPPVSMSKNLGTFAN